MKRALKILIGAVMAAAVLVTGGTWVYINVIRDDPPERLALADAADPATGTTEPTAAPVGGSDEGDVNGVWAVTTGSQAGYRVEEILFGQNAVAVGRTEDVTGEIAIAGATVTSGSFTVDMTTIASDESRRDGQFRGRIMDVGTYPTSRFDLTRPIELASVPADGEEVDVQATGRLTLRGTTREVTVDLTAQRLGGTLRILGTIPIVFDEWGIPNPSGGPAATEDEGELEFLLVFART